MKPSEINAYAAIALALIVAVTVVFAIVAMPAKAENDGPLELARDGFFYVNVKSTKVGDRDYVSHQMYVEVRIPAKQTHP